LHRFGARSQLRFLAGGTASFQYLHGEISRQYPFYCFNRGIRRVSIVSFYFSNFIECSNSYKSLRRCLRVLLYCILVGLEFGSLEIDESSCCEDFPLNVTRSGV
jgi:hypothetical protein